jgi:hypothetical protein
MSDSFSITELTKNDKSSKMSGLAKQISEAIECVKPGLFFVVKSDDVYKSNLCIQGSFDPVNTWANNIYENSRCFTFWIYPHGTQYYEEEQKIEIELTTRCYKIPKKFRKYTGTPDKAVAKLINWIKTAVD